jgi:hypothetical protein
VNAHHPLHQPRSIAYVSPTIDDEGELEEQYNIDCHTLQLPLVFDELSRLEIEPDHAAIIFKRPRSEHSNRGQLHQEIVVGAEACTRNIWLS